MSDLEANRVSVRAGGRLIIDGVDVTAPAGSLTAVVGPNGAGKSTLLRALAAVEAPAAGSVVVDDRDLFASPRRTRARLAALVEQESATDLDLTVRDVVTLGRLPYEGAFGGADPDGATVIDEAMQRTSTERFADRLFRTLSGGERQRVLLAKALAQQTPLLVLDEPTNHLDIAAQLSTLRLLNDLARSGRSVLAALHDLSLTAAWADRVVMLSDGRVVAAGPTADVLTAPLVTALYGVETTILTHPLTGTPVLAFSELR
jgi:iron complex transport system ATP-binding protein